MNSARRNAPATARNRDPILAVLQRVLPTTGTVLEIASGTGEHAVYFGAKLPDITWQPSDADPSQLASIAAWTQDSGVANVLGCFFPCNTLDSSSHTIMKISYRFSNRSKSIASRKSR